MNILIVLPPNMPSGGNWTYSGRLQRGLLPRGIHITIKPLDQVTDEEYASHDIIHSYNAFLTGRHVAPIAKRHDKPLVLTMTGTDVNEHLQRAESRPSMVEAVEYASRIIFLTDQAKQNLSEVYPGADKKSQVINLGIDLPQGAGKTREQFGIANDEFVFLLVAGIRSVKRPLDAFAPLGRLHEEHDRVRFLLAGSVLDDELFAGVVEAFDGTDYARYLGEVPYSEIIDLYRAADVVMNTSSSEGLSHALLEAMSVGKPILASHVPGNRDLIQDGQNGFLYRDADEFVEKARILYEDAAKRQSVAEGGLETIRQHYSLERELDAFFDMYKEVHENMPCTHC